MTPTTKTCVFALTGFLVGVIIARLLFLDRIEVVAFGMFFRALGHGAMAFSLKAIICSHTFIKCVGTGVVLGGVAAVYLAPHFPLKSSDEDGNA